MSRVFQNLPSRVRLTTLTNTPITVDGEQYNFDDYIENEWVSDFPRYSQRVRSIAKNVAIEVDNFLNDLNINLGDMESNLKSEVNDFIENKESEFEDWKINKVSEYENWIRDKQDEFDSWETNKQGEITIKLNDMDTRISQYDNLRQGIEATDTNLGYITLNKVRELASQSMNETRANTLIINKLKEYGIGRLDTTNIDINSRLANGLYVTTHSSKINGRTTVVINSQYGTNWGVQLGIAESANPTLHLRSKQNGNWTNWLSIPNENRVVELITTNAPRPTIATQDEIDEMMTLGINFENIDLVPIFGNSINSRNLIELLKNERDLNTILNNNTNLNKVINNEKLLNGFVISDIVMSNNRFLNKIFENSNVLNRNFRNKIFREEILLRNNVLQRLLSIRELKDFLFLNDNFNILINDNDLFKRIMLQSQDFRNALSTKDNALNILYSRSKEISGSYKTYVGCFIILEISNNNNYSYGGRSIFYENQASDSTSWHNKTNKFSYFKYYKKVNIMIKNSSNSESSMKIYEL